MFIIFCQIFCKGDNVNKHNIMLILMLLAILLIPLSGCSNSEYKKFLIPGQLDQNRYEYIADEIVIKEGYYFLWFIPFASNSQDAAEEKMVEEAQANMPAATGLMEITSELHEDVEFLDWTPRTILRGKLVKNR